MPAVVNEPPPTRKVVLNTSLPVPLNPPWPLRPPATPTFNAIAGIAIAAIAIVANFAGTRVPVEFLFQFLEDDQTLDTFLAQFPSVSRAHAQSVLGASRDLLLGS